MAVLLQLTPGGLPPFLPILANNIRHEHMVDLFSRRFAAVAVQHQLDQLQMLRRGHLPQRLQVRSLAREDVVFGNGLEGFGGKSQIHRVAGLVLEVDHEAGKDGIDRLDASKTPAPVHAKAGGGQLHQGVNVVSVQFPRRCHFLEFFFHKVS